MSCFAMQEKISKEIYLRQILVGTDFSEFSRGALAYAIALAKHYGSTIRIVHAIPPEPLQPVPLDALPDELNRQQFQAKAEMQKLEQEAGIGGVRHRTEIVSGEVGDVLSAVVDRDRPDLLVLGTHGRGGLKKLAFGSIAEQAVRLASCPVLTVGPHVADPSPDTIFKSILFATDFGAASTHAFPLALAMAEEYGSKLVLLHMLPRMSFASVGASDYAAAAYSEQDLASWYHRLHEDSLGKLKALVPRDNRLAVKPVYVVETDLLAEGILQSAMAHKSDLIIMGANETRSPRVAAHVPWVVVHDVICKAHCPVLTVRGAAAEGNN
jgi:nucleotide-binding universal stress UspA family protein